MRKGNQVLFFSSFNYVVHGDQALLNLSHHSFFSLKGHLLVSLVLLPKMDKLGFDIVPKLEFVFGPDVNLLVNLAFQSFKQLVEIVVVLIGLLTSDLLLPLSLLFALVENGDVLISMFFHLDHHV